MMQPRCAVCDGDGQLQTLCDLHFWLRIWRYCVDSGDFSDWPPLVALALDTRLRLAGAAIVDEMRRIEGAQRGDAA